MVCGAKERSKSMSTKYYYNVTGKRRKALAKAVGSILEKPVDDAKAPSFTYTIDFCVLDRQGVISFPDNTNADTIGELTGELRKQGYLPEMTVNSRGALTVEVSRKDFDEQALDNLKKIIASKKTVIKKALKAKSLKLLITEDTIRFPWFTLHGAEGEEEAYHHFVQALCNMAKKQKRVIAKEQESQNDKFTMRLFLVRLGLIGDEYHLTRKVLLSHLTGNGSWKAGYDPKKMALETSSKALASSKQKP